MAKRRPSFHNHETPVTDTESNRNTQVQGEMVLPTIDESIHRATNFKAGKSSSRKSTSSLWRMTRFLPSWCAIRMRQCWVPTHDRSRILGFVRDDVETIVYQWLPHRSNHMLHKALGVQESPHHSADAKQLPTGKAIIGNVIAEHNTFKVRLLRRKAHICSHPLTTQSIFI
jgi:hypothetical protein